MSAPRSSLLHLFVLYMSTPVLAFGSPSCKTRIGLSRRQALAGLAALGLRPSQASEPETLLMKAFKGDEEYKDLGTQISSKLLNSVETAAESNGDALGGINWRAPKVTGLSTEEMAKRLDAGLRSEC